MSIDRIVLHIDLDAFYASVEQKEHPEYKGKPLIVGADPKNGAGRGVVATASYEAREFGVKSAMPISKAWKLCPQGIYIKPNFELYARTSYAVMIILRKYSDKFQQLSIDEAFLDVTNRASNYESADILAEKIKKEIVNKEKITCSIGIGPNKLIAKLASDYKKPYGTTVVRPEDVKGFLSKLDVRKLPGIGPKTEGVLKEMTIETVNQLAKVDVKTLTDVFGVFGYRMHEMALGIDESNVSEEGKIKSLGKEMTFENDVDNKRILFQSIDGLIDNFHDDIVSENMQFKTVNVKIRYEDFETHTRAKTLESYTNDKETIKKIAKSLLGDMVKRKVRLIGVRVSNFKFGESQKTLKMYPKTL